jgi:exopolysaccharide production protein ExoY
VTREPTSTIDAGRRTRTRFGLVLEMSVVAQSVAPWRQAQEDRPLRNSAPPRRSAALVSRGTVRRCTFIAGDALILLLIFFVLVAIRELAPLDPANRAVLETLVPAQAASPAQFVSAVLAGLLLLDLYGSRRRRQDARRLLGGTLVGLGFQYWMVLWLAPSSAVTAALLLLASVIALPLLLYRRGVERAMALAGPMGLSPSRVLLVAGDGDIQRALAQPVLRDRSEFVVCGRIDPETISAPGGGLDAVRAEVRRHGADTIVLCCGGLSDAVLRTILDAAMASGCEVIALSRLSLGCDEPPWLVWPQGPPLAVLSRAAERRRELVLKRAIDIVGAVTGLVLAAPLMLPIAAAIRLSGPGPVLFAHRRIGTGGRPFRCFKFRSMQVDAEERLRRDPVLYEAYVRNNFKLPDGRDPRVTLVGRFLRLSSLDELPQLWNVLRGDMSLVGPRPVVADELGHYGDGAALLLSLKPGLAGAWVAGGRSEVGYPARAELELTYVRNWHLGLDLSILMRTIPMVLTRRGTA